MEYQISNIENIPKILVEYSILWYSIMVYGEAPSFNANSTKAWACSAVVSKTGPGVALLDQHTDLSTAQNNAIDFLSD